MIQLKNVGYAIGHKSILSDITWSAEPGKVNLIIGTNGAGKSTLLNLLSGEHRPSSGQISWDHSMLQDVRSPERFRGVLSQQHSLQFPLSVKEVIELGRYPHLKHKSTADHKQIIEEVIDLFELGDMTHRNIQTLSGGEQQRVHFARVWVQMMEDVDRHHKMLIVDEPTTYLDIHHQWKYMEMIREATKKHGWITVGVLHDLPMVRFFADEVLILDGGKKVASGSAAAVLTESRISEIFNIRVKEKEGQLVVQGT